MEFNDIRCRNHIETATLEVLFETCCQLILMIIMTLFNGKPFTM